MSVTSADDPKAVEIGLRLALQKFGPSLKVEGSDEFKRQLVEVALKTGLRVDFSNQEMNADLKLRRDEWSELQVRGKAFIDGEKSKDRRAQDIATPVPPAVDKFSGRFQPPGRSRDLGDLD